MYKMKFQIFGTLVLFFTLANGSLAHHAISEDMDIDNPVQLQGKIIRVEWINPHVVIHVQIQNAYGVYETWLVQADTPNGLLRRGLNRTALSAVTVPNGPVLTIPPSNAQPSNSAPSISIVVFQTKDKSCMPDCMGYGYTITDPNGRTSILNQKVYDLSTELKFGQ